MKYASIDTGLFPIVKVTYQGFEPTMEEFNEYLNELLEIYNRKKHFVLIFDASKAKYLKAELRVEQGKWIEKNQNLIKQYCLGNSFVISNPIIKIVFNCILAVKPPPVNYAVFSHIHNASEWAKEQLATPN